LEESLSQRGFKLLTNIFEAGKRNKNIQEAMRLYELLEERSFARDSTLIAVGGGVIGDLAGFVASTYLRGMNLIHVPTTLTGMIDSSIGGKNAINFKNTINAIGNYYHPLLNVIDLQFIDTLPEREYRAGLSEIIKCSIITDRILFDYLGEYSGKIMERDEEFLVKIICAAIEIKLAHVTGDVREQNRRLQLNYGHTLGHAVELSTGVYEEVYRHGEGVALGMVGAAYVARDYFGRGSDVLNDHETILKRYGLPVRVETSKIGFKRDPLIRDCLEFIRKDKKRKRGRMRFILPLEIGKCSIVDDVEHSLIEDAFAYLIQE
jgi:3-dehydroquinate synthase